MNILYIRLLNTFVSSLFISYYFVTFFDYFNQHDVRAILCIQVLGFTCVVAIIAHLLTKKYMSQGSRHKYITSLHLPYYLPFYQQMLVLVCVTTCMAWLYFSRPEAFNMKYIVPIALLSVSYRYLFGKYIRNNKLI